MRSGVCKVLCFYLPPRGHCGPNPRGCPERASTYPRPYEERVGDLYQSEHSERPRYTKYPEYTKSSSDDDGHIFVGWVGGTPEYFLFLRLRWILALFCPLCFSLSPCLFPVFFVARVPVLNLTALCLPYLFQVCLVFPHRLALILH